MGRGAAGHAGAHPGGGKRRESGKRKERIP